VRVLSPLFRRLFLEKLVAAHAAGRLQFFGAHANLADCAAFAQYLAPSRGSEWVVYSKRPFGGPEAVLAYLSRYTHRVAISNSRLLACNGDGVAFKYKDYRVEGRARQKVMLLATDEFIRRFLIHVLPTGTASISPGFSTSCAGEGARTGAISSAHPVPIYEDGDAPRLLPPPAHDAASNFEFQIT